MSDIYTDEELGNITNDAKDNKENKEKIIPTTSPRLIAYEINPSNVQIVPGIQQREWMDDTPQKFAYRCLPLNIANCSGWQILCPNSFTAYWNGGPQTNDIRFEYMSEEDKKYNHALSHFGSGVLTFSFPFLFKTDPGWALIAKGAPNYVKDGIQALEGLIETDWLPFTFTMNWIFTRPGFVHFQKGEPVAFLQPTPHILLDDMQPIITPLSNNPKLDHDFRDWATKRDDFNKRLHEGEASATKEGWQKHYIRGENASGEKLAWHNKSKRKLKAPVYIKDYKYE